MAVPGLLTRGIPPALHPLGIGVGGITRRAGVDGRRDILALSVVFDHAVTDGAPVGRFIHRLHELMTVAGELGGSDADDAEPGRADRGREDE